MAGSGPIDMPELREMYQNAARRRLSERSTGLDNLATLSQSHIRRNVLTAVALVVTGLLATQLHPDLRIGTKIVTGASETSLPALKSIDATQAISLPPGDDWFSGLNDRNTGLELRRQILEETSARNARNNGGK